MIHNAALNIGVQIPTRVPTVDSLGHVPRSGAAGSGGNSVFDLGGTTKLSSTVAASCIPPAMHEVPVPPHLLSTC